MKELVLGKGEVTIGTITRGNRKGILISQINPTPEIEVGQRVPGFVVGETIVFKDSDVVIWCDSLAGTRVLQDVVNAISLMLSGYVVKES